MAVSLESLHRLISGLQTATHPRVCEIFMDWLKEEVKPRLAALFVSGEENDVLSLSGRIGLESLSSGLLPFGKDPWDWLREQDISLPRGERFTFPITIQGKTYGLLVLVSRRQGRTLSTEKRLLELALAYFAPILHDARQRQKRNIVYDVSEHNQAEQTLRESEERYRTYIQQANDYIFTLDAAGRITSANQAMCEALGYEQGELLGRFALDFVAPEAREEAAKALQRIWNGETIDLFDLPVQARSGEILYVQVRGRAFYRDGQLMETLHIARDITSSKQAEEALRLAEEKYRTLIEYVPVILYLDEADEYSSSLYISPQVQDLLGYSPEDFRRDPRLWHNLVVPEDYANAVSSIRKTLESGQAVQEYRVVTRDGRIVWLRDTSVLIRDAQGRPRFIQGFIEDITEQKQAEEAVRNSELRFRALIENALDYISLLDAEGNLLWESPSSTNLLGYGYNEFIGRNVFELIHPEDREHVQQRFTEVLQQDGNRQSDVFRLRRSDGTYFWVEAVATNLLNDPIVGAVVVNYHDITERVQRERELEAGVMIAQALGETLELQPLLQKLLAATRYAIPAAEKGSILLVEADGRLRIHALDGYQDPRLFDFTFASDSGYSARAARERRPLIIHDAHADAEIRYEGEIEEARAIQSAIVSPLMIEERVIGVISLDATVKSAFREQDLRVLTSIASTAALIIERARLFEAEHKQRQLSDALRNALGAGASLSASLEFETVLDRLLEVLEKVVPFDGGCVMVVSPSGKVQIARTRGYRCLGERAKTYFQKMNFEITSTANLRWMYEHKRALIIPDVGKYPGWVRIEDYEFTRSWAGAPIIINDEVVAFFSLDRLTSNSFTAEDAALLEAYAGQASLALQNARLFEETRRRAEETAALLETSLALNTLDLDETLRTIGEHAKTLFAADGCRIFLLEPGGETLRCVLALQESQEAFRDLTIKLGQGVTGSVAASGQAEIVNSMQNDPRAVQVPGTPEEEEAIMFAPLKEREHTLGVISIRRIGSDRPFKPEDLELLKAFASMAASAVSNARLFEDTQKRLSELSVLHQSSQSLLVAGFDPSVTYASVHEAVKRVMPSDAFVIVLEDEAKGDYHAVYRYDKGVLYPPARVPRGQGLSGQVISEGKTLLVDDYHARNDIQAVHFGYPKHVRSILAIPLKRGGRTFGMISTQSYAPNVYDERHRALLETIAAQFASSIETARLFEETQRRLHELETLQSLSSALRQAHTVEEMLPLFIRYAARAVGAQAGSIYLLDESSGELISQGWITAEGEWLTGTSELRHRPGEGVTGWVAERGEIYVTEDWRTDTVTRILPGENRYLNSMRTGISLPLHAEERIVGVMHIWYTERHVFTDSEKHLLVAIADMAGNALQRVRLHEETIRQVKRLTALRDMDRVIASSFDLRLVFNFLLTHVTKYLNVDAASILLFNPHTHTLEYAAGRGFRSNFQSRAPLRLGEGLAGKAAMERQLIAIPDLDAVNEKFAKAEVVEGEEFRAYYAYPLITKGEIKGVLEAFHRTPLFVSPDWLNFFEALAGQAAIAIDNARMFENLERSNLELTLAYDETIEGWSRALDLRDRETEGHTRRVTELTLRLAQQFGLKPSDMLHLRRGALLHDIGKIAIPDHILLKPGPLTDEEWTIMRQHPQYAYDFLSSIEYLRPALDIPYCHHEKCDGSGYPRGLKGEEIPLAARIFAVADVWDALTSHRPYRPAWSREQALEYIRSQAGKHFDPQVVEAFLRIIESEIGD